MAHPYSDKAQDGRNRARTRYSEFDKGPLSPEKKPLKELALDDDDDDDEDDKK